jgi:hypothetical protein
MTEQSNGARTAPKITPFNVSIHDQSSHCWRTFKVVMPAGGVMQDLTDSPGIWGPVQADRQRKLGDDDLLYVTAHDRSWAVTCRVVEAGPHTVVLSKPKVEWSGQEARTGVQWQDEHYAVKWTGDDLYGVFRKGVGSRPESLLQAGFRTVDAAKSNALKQYPQQV